MLEINHVSYAYDTFEALRDATLTIADGEILCLLGPSGCGKTTLLRVIAGLETGYTGRISIEGHDLRNKPVHELDFGLMFQDFALFPHMTVEQNIAYGLQRQRVPQQEIQNRVQAMLGRVGLSGFEKRDVNLLSGGQKQRVALARSLAPNPMVLMLDEPLGSLDALLRDQLIIELRDIIKSVGLTAIYVTHDQKEAYAIADRVAVMNTGQILQVDTPQNVYYAPRTEFVARFLGLSNIFKLDSNDMIHHRLVSAGIHDYSSARAILVHPVGIYLDKPIDRPSLELEGQVELLIFRGEYYQTAVRIADEMTLYTTTRKSTVAIGEPLTIFIATEYILPLN